MTEFTGFSVAAKLYAENIALVREMERTYKEEVEACLKSLEVALELVVAPQKLNSHSTPSGYRYWWLGDRSRDAAHLSFNRWDPDDLNPVRLSLRAGSDEKQEAALDALVKLGIDEGLQAFDEADRNNIFYFEVPLEGDAFVEKAAGKIGGVLQSMEVALTKLSDQ